MSVTPPPQAYTRDMLAHAYEWLQGQPENIRDMATNMDSMVALYLQAKRRGQHSMNTSPVSAQTFKQDLKTLAEGLKQFEAESMPATTFTETRPAVTAPQAPPMQVPPMQVPPMPAPRPAAPTMTATPTLTPTMPMPPQLSQLAALDEKSLKLVGAVRTRLNLSNENEALRVLIAVGYERLREIMPTS